jgi:hypothetical protein
MATAKMKVQKNSFEFKLKSRDVKDSPPEAWLQVMLTTQGQAKRLGGPRVIQK